MAGGGPVEGVRNNADSSQPFSEGVASRRALVRPGAAAPEQSPALRRHALIKIKRVIAGYRRGTKRPVPNYGTCEFRIVEHAGCNSALLGEAVMARLLHELCCFPAWPRSP